MGIICLKPVDAECSQGVAPPSVHPDTAFRMSPRLRAICESSSPADLLRSFGVTCPSPAADDVPTELRLPMPVELTPPSPHSPSASPSPSPAPS